MIRSFASTIAPRAAVTPTTYPYPGEVGSG